MPRLSVSRPAVPLLARFLAKLVLDIMPAALTSVIGGFLVTHYQFSHAVPPRPVAEEATPASAEMLALVRDEHAVIVDYLKAQMAAEKSRLAAPGAEGRDADGTAAEADAKPAALSQSKTADARVALEASARRIAAAMPPARSMAPHSKPAAAAGAPLVIALTAPVTAGQDGAAPADRIARDPDSLMSKTLDLKDHVVAATRHVVFAIGDMFASVGERIGVTSPPARQFSSNS